MTEFAKISGIGPAMAQNLATLGIVDLAGLAAAEPGQLLTLRGVTPARAEAFQAEARRVLAEPEDQDPAAHDVEEPDLVPVSASPDVKTDDEPAALEGQSKSATVLKIVASSGKKAKKSKKDERKKLKRAVKQREAKLKKQIKKLKSARKALKKAS